MGDRAICVVRENDDTPEICLYTHWHGRELINHVRIALQKNWRWNDAPYLARIIFDTMTEGHHGKETGFGISAREINGAAWTDVLDDPEILVDVNRQEVVVGDQRKSFKEFCYG